RSRAAGARWWGGLAGDRPRRPKRGGGRPTGGAPACGGAPAPPPASTTPAGSWPSTSGGGTGSPASTTWRSLWQTPVAAVRSSTSRGPGLLMSMSSSSSGALNARITAAFMGDPPRSRILSRRVAEHLVEPGAVELRELARVGRAGLGHIALWRCSFEVAVEVVEEEVPAAGDALLVGDVPLRHAVVKHRVARAVAVGLERPFDHRRAPHVGEAARGLDPDDHAREVAAVGATEVDEELSADAQVDPRGIGHPAAHL